ncbi:MAG: PKD domain-containing protein [Bacteroidota bacterium]
MLKEASLFWGFSLFTLSISQVNAQPAANFTYTFTNSGCEPDSVVFTNISTDAHVYNWDFGDFSQADITIHPSHWYFGSGTFIVTLTAFDTLSGDSSTAINVINIIETPDPGWASFTTSPLDPVCPGTNVDYILFSSATSVKWYFGDGDSSLLFNPSHIYTDTGTYTITLIASNSCGVDTFFSIISVEDSVTPYADFLLPDSVCPNTAVLFDNTSYPDPVSSFWDFGDGYTSSLLNPVHTYSTQGSYDVTLVTYNDCSSDFVSKTMIVDSSLVPSVSISASQTLVCPGDTVEFIANTDYLSGFLWDFDDSTISFQENPQHAFADTGISNVVLTVTNACGNSSSDSVTIFVEDAVPPSDVDFWRYPNSACPGTVIKFYNTSSDTNDVLWDFGDGNFSTDVAPVHFFNDTGTYNVKLIITSSCGGIDSIVNSICVDDSIIPWASFSYDPYVVMCAGEPVTFSNYSSDISDVFWDFGDGSTSFQINPEHIFNDAGSYNVLLKVSNACGNSGYYAEAITVIFAVNITSVIDIATQGNYDGAIDLTVSGSISPYIYSWSNGDETEDISNIPAGTYSVVVTDANGCVDSASIVVPENPQGFENPEGLIIEGLVIYPNPTDGRITIDVEFDETDKIEIQLYNVLGELLYKYPQEPVQKVKPGHSGWMKYELDLSGLPNGVYFIRVTTPYDSSNKKVIFAR